MSNVEWVVTSGLIQPLVTTHSTLLTKYYYLGVLGSVGGEGMLGLMHIAFVVGY